MFSAFVVEFFTTYLPTSERRPFSAADASNATTTGIAITVDNNPIPNNSTSHGNRNENRINIINNSRGSKIFLI